ncbi:hypothetical protein [Maricaulis sp.]|uniref:hypothetical protein n=1 Tax=Maricaulis sp. TaxID=1486257 RepID=UPI003A94EE16
MTTIVITVPNPEHRTSHPQGHANAAFAVVSRACQPAFARLERANKHADAALQAALKGVKGVASVETV